MKGLPSFFCCPFLLSNESIEDRSGAVGDVCLKRTHACYTDALNAVFPMKVNAWICTCVNDSDLESATNIDHEEWFECETDSDLESGLSKSRDVRGPQSDELCLTRAHFRGGSWQY